MYWSRGNIGDISVCHIIAWTQIILFKNLHFLSYDIDRFASHISLESNLDRFLIPKIPKMDLRSSQIVESDGTLGISKTKNVPIFYNYL